MQGALIGHMRQLGPEHKRLEIFIGKWICQGETIATADAPAVRILTSDAYEWMSGAFFVLHTAYGRVCDIEVGGTEIIGYDTASKRYVTHVFDSQGNSSSQELTASGERGDTWRWSGELARCTAIFSDLGKTQMAHHERLDEHDHGVPSMEVTLTKVA